MEGIKDCLLNVILYNCVKIT